MEHDAGGGERAILANDHRWIQVLAGGVASKLSVGTGRQKGGFRVLGGRVVGHLPELVRGKLRAAFDTAEALHRRQECTMNHYLKCFCKLSYCYLFQTKLIAAAHGPGLRIAEFTWRYQQASVWIPRPWNTAAMWYYLCPRANKHSKSRPLTDCNQ